MCTTNHDRMKLCKDRVIPPWVERAQKDIRQSGCGDTLPGDRTKSGVRRQTYCFCNGPYTGAFMVQCDRCKDWYHGKCVGVTPKQAKGMDLYICAGCKG